MRIVNTTEVESATLEITLTRREAAALLFVVRAIGGSPSKSPRGLFDQINDALLETFPGLLDVPLPEARTHGGVWFNDTVKDEA